MIALCPFLAVAWVCVQFVIVIFPDLTHLLFKQCMYTGMWNDFFLKFDSDSKFLAHASSMEANVVTV